MCLFKNKNQQVHTETIIENNDKTIIENVSIMQCEPEQQTEEKIIIPTTMNNPKYNSVCVCLDNGHASSTPGKRSPFSMRKVAPELPLEEWQFTREIVVILSQMLNEEGIETFIVTPETDLDVALSIRAGRANDYVKNSHKKGLFISVHADANGNGNVWDKACGWSCFTTRGQNNSDKFADCLYDAAEEILVPMGRRLRTDKSDGDRDWEQDFTVIYKANMPAVLTENLFYTNVDDCRFLLSDEGKHAIAKVHLEGIKKYIERYI